MIVVVVNTIVYFWIPGEMTEFAIQAFAKDPEWAAPILWRSELRNILAGYIRRKQLTEAQAAKCLDGAESQLKGNDYILPSPLIMELVKQSSCSAYDCEYAALAKDLNVKLVTSDKQILDQFPKLAVSLRAFAE